MQRNPLKYLVIWQGNGLAKLGVEKSQCTNFGVDVEIVILDVGLTFEVCIEITFEE